MAWDAHALFLLGGGTLGTAIGLLVLALAPSRPANQILATILVAQGVFPQGVMQAFAVSGTVEGWVETASGRANIIAIVSLGFLHLLFIGQAIPHASVAWLRTQGGAWAIIAAWCVALLFVLVGSGGWLMAVSLSIALAAAVYSAVAAWLEMGVHAHGSARRRRARAYFAAFVTRDVGLAWMTVTTAIDHGVTEAGTWPYVAGRTIMLVSHVLIAAALLKGQVLGLNRKLASGTSYTLAAGVLVLCFEVAMALIEESIAARRSVGIGLAVALALLFSPLQHSAQRLLVRLFPSARAVADLGPDERRAMYQEQVELAWADGELGAKEQRMLDRMAAALGLTDDVGPPATTPS